MKGAVFNPSGGGAVKSVQRGNLTLSSGYTDVTINAVDLSKSVVHGNVTGASGSPIIACFLANSTTVRFYNPAGYASLSAFWQVVEYK